MLPTMIQSSYNQTRKGHMMKQEIKEQYQKGDMLSTSQAAELLGISRQRISILLKEKRIPGAIKVNRYWAIPYESLLDMPDRKPGNPHDNK